jgi:hypothetical protein
MTIAFETSITIASGPVALSLNHEKACIRVKPSQIHLAGNMVTAPQSIITLETLSFSRI